MSPQDAGTPTATSSGSHRPVGDLPEHEEVDSVPGHEDDKNGGGIRADADVRV